MRLRFYQIDAFSGKIFGGNPAGVCPLESWLDDDTLQAIAAENNLSETAFFVVGRGNFALRWFTPVAEVDLCGHATLAAAFVIFTHLDPTAREVRFQTRSGLLTVRRGGDLLTMLLPVLPPEPCDAPADLLEGLGVAPTAVLVADDYLAVYKTERQVRALAPDMKRLSGLDKRGVIVTAPGKDCDFVSRFFAPRFGVPEDPVTGSAHCTLVPYWSNRLKKGRLRARQVSRRGGELYCEDRGSQVAIAGRAVQYLEGTIWI